jgi:STE24 endopeptidase
MSGAAPIELSRYFTPEDLRRGAAWLRIENVAGLADLAIDLAVLIALSLGAPGRRLWGWLAGHLRRASPAPAGLDRLLGDDWRTGGAYLGIVGFVRCLAALPLIIGVQYYAAHAYGLSHESILSVLRRAVIMTAFVMATAALLGSVIGVVRERWPRRWWLAVGAGAAILLAADAALEPLQLRINFQVRPLPPGALRTRLESLMVSQHADTGPIMTIDASRYGTEANAWVSGFGPTRQLILTDTLLGFGDDAVVGAVAHEIGHRRDQRLPFRLALAGGGMIFFLWLVELTLRWSASRGLRHSAQGIPLVKVMVAVLMLGLGPVRMTFSRAEEREADAVELSIRRDYDAYIAEQVRLARANAMDPDPPGILKPFMSHPSVAERIRRAEEYKLRSAEATATDPGLHAPR